MSDDVRTEHDLLGAMSLPADCLHGVHTARALENFPLAGRPVPTSLIHAYGTVKLASAKTNRELGVWQDASKADAIERACHEMSEGLLDERACQLVQLAEQTGKTVKQCATDRGWLTPQQFDELVSPEAVCRLGSPDMQGGPKP